MKLNKGVLFVLCAFSAGALLADVTTWIGPSGSADWNEPENWDNGVPADDGDANFAPRTGTETRYWVKVSPPSAFVGRILTSNEMSKAVGFKSIVELEVGKNAAWTISGNGTVVATPGIGARIGSDFVGEIEVPFGTTFEDADTINAAVSYVGAGNLVLSSVDRADEIEGFVGKVVLPSGVVVPTASSFLQGRGLSLANGTTVSLSDELLAYGAVKEISDWGEPGMWSLNGRTLAPGPEDYPYNQGPASVLANGDLMLVDAPTQLRSAFYTNRVFHISDSWGCSFIWTPELPNPSIVTRHGGKQDVSGDFIVGIQAKSATNVSSADNYRNPVDEMYGFKLYTYRSGNKPSVTWIHGQARSTDDYLHEKGLNGISLAKPIEFHVSFCEGMMYVTLVQDGKSRSFSHSFSTFMAGRGVWFGVGGSSDSWNNYDNVPWNTFRLSEFRGWYSSEDAGDGWTDIADQSKYYPFNETHWHLIQNDPDTHTGADCVGPDGTFEVIADKGNYASLAVSKLNMSIDKRYLITFSADWGAIGGSGAGYGMLFGFCKPSWEAAQFDASKIKPGSTSLSLDADYGYGLTWTHSYKDDYLQGVCRYDASKTTSSSKLNSPVPLKSNARADYRIRYDGNGHSTVSLATRRPNAEGAYAKMDWSVPADKFSAFKTKTSSSLKCQNNVMHMVFRGGTHGSDLNLYFKTVLGSLVIKEYAANNNLWVGSPIFVADNAAASLNVDSAEQVTPAATVANVNLGAGASLSVSSAKVAFKSVTVGGVATMSANAGASVVLGTVVLTGTLGANTLNLTGDVDFGETLDLVVPESWLKFKGSSGVLIAAPGARYPESIRLLTDDGVDHTEAFNIKVSNGNLSVTVVKKGLIMMVR